MAQGPAPGFKAVGHSAGYRGSGKYVPYAQRTTAGSGKGGARSSAYSSALYQPSQVLTGQPLASGAMAIANAQTQGPLTELARQIAQNQRQTAGAQKLTSGYFGQLLPFAQQSVTDQQGIAGGLNQQLAGLGAQSQQAIGQAYQPTAQMQQLAAQGLGGGGDTALAGDRARALSTSAQNAQTFGSAGATLGANASSLAAGNLGAFALRGQERIGGIGQAGQIRNEPLASKQAGLIASKGSIYADALGKLRQGERAYLTTLSGLGLNQQKLAEVTGQNQAANAIKVRGQDVTAADAAAAQAGQNQRNQARLDAAATRDALNRAARNAKTRSKLPLTQAQQNTLYGQADRLQALIADAQKAGGTEAQIRQALQSGNNPARSHYPKALIQAAFEVKGWGHITPGTARQLYAMGLRGTHFKVAAPPAPGVFSQPF